jgi:hypothetical protein
MSEIAHATPDDLRSILAVFGDTTWPVPRAEVLAIAEGLGWTVRSDQERGIMFMTGLPYRRARADCLLLEDQLGQLTIGLTDRVNGGDPASRAPLRAIEQEAVAVATEVLGEPAGSSSGRSRTHWDLAAGARIAVENTGERVLLSVLGQQYADVERAEARLGVDPDRVVGVDPEPS